MTKNENDSGSTHRIPRQRCLYLGVETRMLQIGLLCITIIVSCTLIHYEILSTLKTNLGKIDFVPHRAKIILVILCAMLSHFLQIFLYALIFYLLRDRFGLGNFGGQFQD